MTVTVQYALERFDDLASAVDHGEAVEIARPDKPSLKLVISEFRQHPRRITPRVLGAGKAFAYLPDEEELDRIDREWKQMIDDRVVGEPRTSAR
jgi:antitoxin (DNA-binding transcriptional repressor) of toxin-antitoxin stability system